MLVNVFRGRGLYEDAMDSRVAVELCDQLHHLFLGGGGGELVLAGMHAERGTGAVLTADIGLGGGILTDQHDGESGGDASGLECLDAGLGFEFYLGGDRLAINEFHGILGDKILDVELLTCSMIRIRNSGKIQRKINHEDHEGRSKWNYSVSND
jgi:hypothetical protein